jgi:hypothetical protein
MSPKRVAFQFSSCLTFSLLLPFFPHNYGNISATKIRILNIKTAFLLHGPMTFATREPLSPLPPQNTLDHDNGLHRTKNRSFGNLKFHDHSCNYFSWCKPKCSWDKFNDQSYILKEPKSKGQLHCPRCKQPLGSLPMAANYVCPSMCLETLKFWVDSI